MTGRATTLGQRFAADLEDLRELERAEPAAAETVASLGTLGPPTEKIADPRTVTP